VKLEDIVLKFVNDLHTLYAGRLGPSKFNIIRKIEVDENVWQMMVYDVSPRLKTEYMHVTLDTLHRELRIFGIHISIFEPVRGASPLFHGDAEILFKRAGVKPEEAPGLFARTVETLAQRMAELSTSHGMSYGRIELYSDTKHSLFEKILANKSNGTLK
jgi:hypothetical protein